MTLNDIEQLTTADVHERYPYFVDFFSSFGLALPADEMTIRQYVMALDHDMLLDLE